MLSTQILYLQFDFYLLQQYKYQNCCFAKTMINSQQQVFNPESSCQNSSSVYRKPRNRRNNQNGSWGKWTDQESLIYVMFMQMNGEIFNSREKRRVSRIFKAMSQYIPTRTAIQCRSHHQKLVTKFRNFRKIIAVFKNQYGIEKYQKAYQAFIQGKKPIESLADQSSQASQPCQKDVETQTKPVKIIELQQEDEQKTLNSVIDFSKYPLNPILITMLNNLGWQVTD